MMRAVRQPGTGRMVLVTGDRADIAETIGRIVGVDAVYPDRDPAEKLAIVHAEQTSAPTIMVVDGVDDALAAAGVGVALAARGTTASAEVADVELTADRGDGLADAVHIVQTTGPVLAGPDGVLPSIAETKLPPA
jgi:P-type E1-E2 ATPase